MAKTQWTKTDQVLYHTFYIVLATGVLIAGIAHIIEACRSRPKVQVLAFGVKADPEKSESEISSAEK